MAGRPPSEARAAEMRRVLADLDRTDLSTKAFCERRGISRSLLSYWRKRLTATEGAMSLAADRSGAFVPVRIVGPRQRESWIVELSDGTRIHVPPGFDPEELRRLMREVRAC
jgi:hypothetical protein